MNIGTLIKQVRENKGLSLRDVSERCGLSASFIGQIERDETSPSMRSIKSITDALGIKLTELFKNIENQENPSPLVVLHNRRKIENLFLGVEMYLISPSENRNLQSVIVYAQPGASTGENYFKHDGEEFAYLLSGTLWIWLDGKEYNLREGDSFGFNSNSPHKWENRGILPSICLWVLTPPSW